MALVTLTTDLGLKDHYLPALKGAILRLTPEARFIDVSHLVQPQNIIEAAFVLGNCWREFPKGSIHIICVDTLGAHNGKFLLTNHDGHFFIAPDNGVLSLMFENETPAYHIVKVSEEIEENISRYLYILSQTIRDIVGQESIESFARSVNYIQTRSSLLPVVGADFIKGSVVHIDRFKNAVTNIQNDEFERLRKNRAFEIVFNRYAVRELHNTYQAVPEAEKLCLFNSSGHLEIAMNKSNAADLLGLRVGSRVLIEFR